MNHGEHGELRDCSDQLVDVVLTPATAVHMAFGPGLLESVYEAALAIEFVERGIRFERQIPIPVSYHRQSLGVGFRADMLVEGCLLLELKCVEEFAPIHLAQVITYLKLLRLKRGYLLNFNKRLLKEGIKRVSI